MVHPASATPCNQSFSVVSLALPPLGSCHIPVRVPHAGTKVLDITVPVCQMCTQSQHTYWHKDLHGEAAAQTKTLHLHPGLPFFPRRSMPSLLWIHSPFQQRRDGYLGFMGTCDCVEGETILTLDKKPTHCIKWAQKHREITRKWRKAK